MCCLRIPGQKSWYSAQWPNWVPRVRTYTAMLAQSREQSLDRLRAEALELGGNAVVGMRITTSTVMQGAAEILAYGTAVLLEKE